jgi:hypothetical protein
MEDLMRALAGRLKAAFATHAALSAEADLARLDAERRADLLRQAERMEAEGLGVAAEALRKSVAKLDEHDFNGVSGTNGMTQSLPALAVPVKETERKKK